MIPIHHGPDGYHDMEFCEVVRVTSRKALAASVSLPERPLSLICQAAGPKHGPHLVKSDVEPSLAH